MNSIKIIIKELYSLFYLLHFIIYIFSKKRELIKEDIKARIKDAKSEPNHYAIFAMCMRDRYFRSLYYYRIGEISKYISWTTKQDITYIIDDKCIIGGGMYNPHSYATIIHAKRIGCFFSHRQCTTIGNKVDGRNDLIPTIGNHVTLGANVVIIGNISIGNNVVVGAGSVITKDIPDNATVVGNPARILSFRELNKIH